MPIRKVKKSNVDMIKQDQNEFNWRMYLVDVQMYKKFYLNQ